MLGPVCKPLPRASPAIETMNDIIDEDDVMHARTLARVEMPNRDGFIVAYPEREDR